MAIVRVTGDTQAVLTAINTTLTLTVPASLSSGDVMLAWVALEATASVSVSTPSGWTKVGEVQHPSPANYLAVYYRFWVSGDTNPVFTWTGSYKGGGGIVPYRGVDSSSPFDVTSVFASNNSAASEPDSDITAVTCGACRIAILSNDAVSNYTADFRMLKVREVDTTGGLSSTNSTSAFFEEKGMADGAFGARTHTNSSSAAWCSFTTFLRPAVADTIGLIQSAKATSGGQVATLTATMPNNGTAGSTIIAECVTFYNGDLVNDVDYNGGLNFTKDAEILAGVSSGPATSIWRYSNNAQTASAPVVVGRRSNANIENFSMVIQEYKGLDTSSPLDTTQTATGTGTAVTATTPTTSSGDRLVCAVTAHNTSGSPTWTVPLTHFLRFQFNNSSLEPIAVQDRVFAGGGTETVAYTMSSNAGNWYEAVAVYKAAGGAAPSGQPFALRTTPVKNVGVKLGGVF